MTVKVTESSIRLDFTCEDVVNIGIGWAGRKGSHAQDQESQKLFLHLINIIKSKKNSAYDIIADYSPLLPLPRTTLRLLTTMESQI